MNRATVTSYRNPDLDGVATALTLARYLNEREGVNARATIVGRLDAETACAFGLIGLAPPEQVQVIPVDHDVYLVDTHHLRQIEGFIEPSRVVGIIDHHPGGDPTAFPRARIINELVGAAATLVAERCRAEM